MSELRWILLGIGLVLLVLIYFFSRRSSSDDSALLPPSGARHEPSLAPKDKFASRSQAPDSLESSVDAIDDVDNDEVVSASSASRFARAEERQTVAEDSSGVAVKPHISDVESAADEPAPEPPSENVSAPVVLEKVIALHLMPKSGQMFEGLDFIGAVQAEGLKFGRFDIFHRFADPDRITASSPSQFSLANMIKPGTFNLHDIDQQQFKGASMFLVLPGPKDAVAAFADMVATGRRLAATLDGQLLDAQGTALSRQSASHLREDIINYQHGLSAAPAE